MTCRLLVEPNPLKLMTDPFHLVTSRRSIAAFHLLTRLRLGNSIVRTKIVFRQPYCRLSMLTQRPSGRPRQPCRGIDVQIVALSGTLLTKPLTPNFTFHLECPSSKRFYLMLVAARLRRLLVMVSSSDRLWRWHIHLGSITIHCHGRFRSPRRT